MTICGEKSSSGCRGGWARYFGIIVESCLEDLAGYHTVSVIHVKTYLSCDSTHRPRYGSKASEMAWLNTGDFSSFELKVSIDARDCGTN